MQKVSLILMGATFILFFLRLVNADPVGLPYPQLSSLSYQYAFTFGIALLAELFIGLAWLRKKAKLKKVFATIFIANLISVSTILFGFAQIQITYAGTILVGEIFAVVFEAAVYFIALTEVFRKFESALLFSFMLNIASLLIGVFTLLLIQNLWPLVFSLQSSSYSAHCIVTPGFYCIGSVTLSTSGNLSFTFGQNLEPAMYNLGLACTTTINATTGMPSPPHSMVLISSSGVASQLLYNPVNAFVLGANTLTLQSGRTIPITGIKCWNATQGSVFKGWLWASYTLGSGTPSTTSNPIVTVRIARLQA